MITTCSWQVCCSREIGFNGDKNSHVYRVSKEDDESPGAGRHHEARSALAGDTQLLFQTLQASEDLKPTRLESKCSDTVSPMLTPLTLLDSNGIAVQKSVS